MRLMGINQFWLKMAKLEPMASEIIPMNFSSSVQVREMRQIGTETADCLR